MRPARTGLGIGASRVNVQRYVPTPHGWWLGADDNGPVDGCVGVTRIEGEDGRPIVVLVNHAVQSSVMNGSATQAGERQVTADLAGATSRRMEESYGNGAVVLFLIGAARDRLPVSLPFTPPSARTVSCSGPMPTRPRLRSRGAARREARRRRRTGRRSRPRRRADRAAPRGQRAGESPRPDSPRGPARPPPDDEVRLHPGRHVRGTGRGGGAAAAGVVHPLRCPSPGR